MNRIRRFQSEGRHEEASSLAEVLLAEAPENRDLLLARATSLRCVGRIDEALSTLDELARLQPLFSRQFQERGLCHVGLKAAAPAIDNLLRAVNINPALPMSWRMLVGLYRMQGDEVNAALAAGHVEALQALPPEIVQATALFHDGVIGAAEQMIRTFLLKAGNHPDAMRLLARIGLIHDALDDAETLLEAVLEIAPDFRLARYDYAETLIKRQRHLDAQIQIEQLLALDPQNFDYRTQAATAAVGLGQNEKAIEIYRGMWADAPASWDVPLWLGHALKTVGQTAEAIDCYRAAFAARPDFGDAYWSLANLKRYRFTDAEIEGMLENEAAPTTSLVDRYHLNFALGKAYEDRGEHAASWRHYERGNALKRSESRYRPEILETNTAEQIRVMNRAFFAARQGVGDERPDPIFVVGLPRSGSTLIEQILASHSEVEGTHELSNIQRFVHDFQGREPDLDHPRYPGVLESVPSEHFGVLGATYLSETRIYRTGKAYFIDKMPNNFRHIGLIHLILPNAKVIDARRDPMSCCFSNLKQLFAQGQEFTYSIEDIARYYRTYLDLMAHWDAVLPGRILRVQHEDVVDDLERQVRRILDHCGLPFEQACVDFYQTARSVRTPSSEQVRQPIFRDGLDQWKPYDVWLTPLREALGDAFDRYRA